MFHLSTPQRVELDSKDTDLRRALALIAECDKKVLRVIYYVTTIPNKVVLVYFDRKLRGRL